ncbi:hypothetical protein WKR88_22735 [Trinickia caryophylli]|uniref:hypothetical protein n=1 Tax=Trinickia caryophylli TaxID=28094 RepID=UPI000A16030B|nr:hypothetical protein [Trinickia caryophylli]WQE12608.1 hypothetical protein U0034_04110 [Trinickia caryophylli]
MTSRPGKNIALLFKVIARKGYEDIKATGELVANSDLDWTLVRIPTNGCLAMQPASLRICFLSLSWIGGCARRHARTWQK